MRYSQPSTYTVKLPPSDWVMNTSCPACKRASSPAGMMTALQSRVSVTGSL